ncbi:MAG: hypothetical protein ABEN55_09525 [Bradymonadaceae bacterium]
MAFDYMGDPELFREAIERQLPRSANFRRVRFSGGSENRVGEMTGQQRNEHDFKAVENPSMVREEMRGGASGDAGDLEIHVLDDILEEGDRVERINGDVPYEVDSIESFSWQDTPVAYRITLTKQHD